MIEHDGCENCRHFTTSTALEITDYCYDCSLSHKQSRLKDKFEPCTNADMIRKMNDEELAKFLNDVSCNATQITICNKECAKCDCDNEVCENMILVYLKSEYKESD